MAEDPPQTGQGAEASIKALSEFLNGNRAEILARWDRSVQKILGAQAEGFDQQIDPLADLLDQFTVLTEGEEAEPFTDEDQRGLPGAGRNLELGPLVTGYVLLRDTIVE